MEEREEKDKKGDGGFVKGLITGIGAAIGLAAIGIGGKVLYDKYNESNTPEDKKTEKEDEKEEQKEDEKKIENKILDKSSTMATNCEEEIEGKDSFICPINQTLMEDPVITPYGTTYERSAILNWLKKNNTDPLTKKKLTKDMLITNYALRSAIQEYKETLK